MKTYIYNIVVVSLLLLSGCSAAVDGGVSSYIKQIIPDSIIDAGRVAALTHSECSFKDADTSVFTISFDPKKEPATDCSLITSQNLTTVSSCHCSSSSCSLSLKAINSKSTSTSFSIKLQDKMKRESDVISVNCTLPTFYRLTYHSDGATAGIAPIDATDYKSGALAKTIGSGGSLVKTHYVFSGWQLLDNLTTVDAGSSIVVSSNTDLYPRWTELPKYKITYDGNGATSGSTPVDSLLYYSGDTVTVKDFSSLFRANYSFGGWNTEANGTGSSYSPSISFPIGSSNVILYAQWVELPKYKITYDGNGATSGSTPVDLNSYYGGNTALAKSSQLARNGYYFNGWNASADGKGLAYTVGGQILIGSSNVILYAQWVELPKYKITYDGNGATSGNPPIDNNSYYPQSLASILDNTQALLKSGYAFSGWNDASNGSGKWYRFLDQVLITSGSITLYAQWTPTYKVTYDITNATSGSAPQDTSRYLSGSLVTILGAGTLLQRDGYTFGGWSSMTNGAASILREGDKVSINSSDLVLSAVWIAIPKFTITYNANQAIGSVPVDTGSYLSTDHVTILGANGPDYNLFGVDLTATPHGTLSRYGYVFLNWNTKPDGSGQSYNSPNIISLSSNLILYAQWAALPRYNVTYNSNGATAGTSPIDTSGSYLQGESVLVMNSGTLIKDLYSFNGWNTKPDGSGIRREVGSSFVMGSENATLYAQWSFVRTPPSSPFVVSAIPGDGSATVNFTAPLFDGGAAVKEYKVVSLLGEVLATGVTSPITVVNLTNGLNYEFNLIAVNDIGSSSGTKFSVKPGGKPGIPQKLTAISGDHSVTLKFNPPLNNGGYDVTGYKIYYMDDLNQFRIINSSETNYDVLNLTPGKIYDFKVSAVTAMGESVWPNVAQVNGVPFGLPSAPLNLSVKVGVLNATVTFDPPINNGGSSIKYTVSVINSLGELEQSQDVFGTSANFDNLNKDETYNFKVVAKNKFGSSSSIDTATALRPHFITSLVDVTLAPSTVSHNCAILDSGDVMCWGRNDYGQLGNGLVADISPIPSIVNLGGKKAISLSISTYSTCAVIDDGSAMCWGRNDMGQLGNNSTIDSPIPVNVLGVGGSMKVKSIHQRRGEPDILESRCALIDDGVDQNIVKCWGFAGFNKTGYDINNPNPLDIIRSRIPSSVRFGPTLPSVIGASTIVMTSKANCVLIGSASYTSSQPLCWGYTNFSPDYDAIATSVYATGVSTPLNAVSLVAGNDFVCALLINGYVSCWGAPDNGRLGNNSSSSTGVMISTPSLVLNGDTGFHPLSGVLSISAGASHACASTASEIICWGMNDYGQLGNLSYNNSLHATPVHNLSQTQGDLSLASDRSCYIVKSTGDLLCWGRNDYNQSGTGSDALSGLQSPQLKSETPGVVSVSMGSLSSCALLGVGTVACWGMNDYGQVGLDKDIGTPKEAGWRVSFPYP